MTRRTIPWCAGRADRMR